MGEIEGAWRVCGGRAGPLIGRAVPHEELAFLAPAPNDRRGKSRFIKGSFLSLLTDTSVVRGRILDDTTQSCSESMFTGFHCRPEDVNVAEP